MHYILKYYFPIFPEVHRDLCAPVDWDNFETSNCLFEAKPLPEQTLTHMFSQMGTRDSTGLIGIWMNLLSENELIETSRRFGDLFVKQGKVAKTIKDIQQW